MPNDLIIFLKFHVPALTILLAAVACWTYFYVIPTSEWNNTIMDCQVELDDMSYEGYEYCVQLNKPRSTLMAR